MNFTNLAFKLNSFMTSGLGKVASFIAADGDVVNSVEASSVGSATFSMVTGGLINLVLRLIYTICKFVLNIIEFLQFVVCSVLGISVKLED